jgi:hypothetical protein
MLLAHNHAASLPRTLLFAVLWILSPLTVGPFPTPRLLAQELACGNCPWLRPGDEVYEVSSRSLPALPPCTTLSPVTFSVHRLEYDGWHAMNDATFTANLQATPAIRTVIYAHGNWMEYCNARERGSYVYKRLASRAEGPIRFIMYSWPSQRVTGPVRDILDKAERADVDTFYFSELLGRIPDQTPIGLLSFSFGARVICGGLHMANGGSLEGRRALHPHPNRQEVRVSLIAPAFDRNWLGANQPYSMAIYNVESLINVYNSRDPALRRFRFIDRFSTPIAAGFTGLNDPRATQPLAADARIRQYDCSADVGTSHDEMTYYRHCCYYNIAIDNVLGK